MRHISPITVLADALRLVLFWLAIPVYGQSLEVAPGALLKITPSQQFMRLEHLKLGDGAKITFAENIAYWQVIAEQVEIGDGVVIDARGTSGKPGHSAEPLSAKHAQTCRDGAAGSIGKPGGNGGHGVNISLHLQIRRLGSLEINTSGGAGGAGGNGGDGQSGGATEGCEQTHGGSAGAGGIGGLGGIAGDVRIQYSYSEGHDISENVGKHINVIAQAGAGGNGGAAGLVGQGSQERYLDIRTLTGARKWVAAGKPGGQARASQPGRAGMPGQIWLEQIQLSKPFSHSISTDNDQNLTPAASKDAEPASQPAISKTASKIDNIAAQAEPVDKAQLAAEADQSKQSLVYDKVVALEQQLNLSIKNQKMTQQAFSSLKKLVQQQQLQIQALQNRPTVKAIHMQGCDSR